MSKMFVKFKNESVYTLSVKK